MWYRKSKTLSGQKLSLYFGYDLWSWGLPLFVDVDYGIVSICVLFFSIRIGWG